MAPAEAAGWWAPIPRSPEIAEAQGINKSYISRILRLALLAPDIMEAILDGRANRTLMLQRLERPLPARWEEQRLAFRCAG